MEPVTLTPLSTNNQYHNNINCTWLIEAPPKKSIAVRFEKFVLEYSKR